MKTIRKVIFLILICSLILSGCMRKEKSELQSPAPEGNNEASGPIYQEKTLTLSQLNTMHTSDYDAVVTEYDLGSNTYQAKSGKEMPYKIRGTIGVPVEKGSYPVIFLFHGSHANEEESARFDTGLRYLVDALAKNGYVAVAIDCNAAYQWKYGDSDDREKVNYIAIENVKALQAVNDGIISNFPIDIKGKLDFSQVGLLGHSRGGYYVFDIAEDLKSKNVSVEAIICIAPAIGVDADTRSYYNSNVAIVVPFFDGDVVNLDGIALYDMLKDKKQNDIILTILKEGNHNYFNENLTRNDSLLRYQEEQITNLLSPNSQREFMANFAVDYFNTIFTKNIDFALTKSFGLAPNTMYHCEVGVKFSSPIDMWLITPQNTQGVTTNECKLTPTIDSWFYQSDKVFTDTVTSGTGNYETKDLLELESGVNGFLTKELMQEDLTDYQYLVFDVVSDPRTVDEQSFSVILTDKIGNATKVIIPEGAAALKKAEGEITTTEIYEETIEIWSLPTPITSIAIPLSEFTNINLEQCKEIKIAFDQRNESHLYFEGISLKK